MQYDDDEVIRNSIPLSDVNADIKYYVKKSNSKILTHEIRNFLHT